MSNMIVSLRAVRSDDLSKDFKWLNDYSLRRYSTTYKPVS